MPKNISIALLALLAGAARPMAAEVDYLREIKPLLTAHCYKCHGAAEQKGGMRLDTAEYARKGGDSGAGFVPGDAAKSLIIQAVEGTHEDIQRMPLKKPPLTAEQIEKLRAWIARGGKAPSDEKPEDPNQNKHWAFVAPIPPDPPKAQHSEWIRNGIDQFIAARLEKEGLTPSAEADKRSLLRRVTLDLTGLPPTPAEAQEFLSDESAMAYERVVERLLNSPHYGERWGRWWLDAARYADSNGYSIDAPRSIWKYRDWVIQAFNRDMPFDQFTIEQLAGDLLPGAGVDQKIATGFHRNTMINEEGGIDKEQFRIESVLDRVNTTATVFLGVTLACSQCHDHKFDPFKQKEYYQLYSFFNNCEEPTLEIASPQDLAARDQLRKQIKDLQGELEEMVKAADPRVADWEMALTEEEKGKLRSSLKTVLEIAPEKRTDKQRRDLAEHLLEKESSYKEKKAEIARLQKKEPKFVTTMIMEERKEPRESFVFIKGDFTRRGETVTPGTPRVLHPFQPEGNPDRLGLARWLVDRGNPLTARVIMNRVWQQYFGKGLVETENDFGTQGSLPTHPELLDYLATEFIRSGWSLKKMHRLIVTSAAYRQSSKARADLAKVDPNNKLLGRQNRLRLDAEIVRDVALASSGLLSKKIGGPSVFPPQPDGVMTLGQSRREWKTSEGEDRYRRTMYTFFWRATPHPTLMLFDAADGVNACTRRIRSNNALQALTLLNDESFYECARELAKRMIKERAGLEERLEFGFELCLGRPPAAEERERLTTFFNERLNAEKKESAASQARRLENAPAAQIKKTRQGEDAAEAQEEIASELAAWASVARVLLNLDETITRE